MKYSRKDYMAKKVSHNDYYAQFVTDALMYDVVSSIGETKLLESNDDSFNDTTDLSQWDKLNPLIRCYCGRSIADANGTGGISLSDTVCVAKQAARIWKEGQTNEL